MDGGSILSVMPNLLCAYWTLATGAALFSLLPTTIAPCFRAAVLLSSCRGKTWESKPDALLGPLTDLDVPQSWFAHFYMVGAAFNAAVLALLGGQADSAAPADASLLLPLLALALLQVHLTRRLAETLLVFRYPEGACMHVIAYLFGLSYYVVLPLSIVPSSAWQQLPGQVVQQQKWADWAPLLSLPQWAAPSVWLGTGVFLAGNLLQLHSHWILGTLREGGRGRGEPAAGPYRIPRGGAFELVSCPHYLAEIVIYAGLLLVLGRSNALVWLIFAWVVANLLLAAMPTHRWYVQNFSAYPRNRRALVPFLY